MARDNKLSRIFLFAYAIIFSVLHGKANRKIKNPKRIVALVLTTNIGDMIFATSVFRSIKEKYPDSYLVVVGSKKNTITLYGNHDIDAYIPTPESAWELANSLKSVKADFGFTLAIGSVDLATMILAGIKSIACFSYVGVKGAHTITYKVLKSRCIGIPFYIGKYVSQEYLRILEPVDIFSTNTSKYIYFNPEVAKKVHAKYLAQGIDLKNERIVAISPGAGTKIKQWPEERFALIADYLRSEENFKIAVIGGPGDRKEIELFKKYLKSDDLIDASGLSLDEMIYFISTCKLLMANDSGPVYMAEAFKVPTLVVVGPTDEIEHPPHGPLNYVVTPKRDTAPTMRGHIVGYDEKEAREQIMNVAMEDVLEPLKKLLLEMKRS